jgi:hypothetical protein
MLRHLLSGEGQDRPQSAGDNGDHYFARTGHGFAIAVG